MVLSCKLVKDCIFMKDINAGTTNATYFFSFLSLRGDHYIQYEKICLHLGRFFNHNPSFHNLFVSNRNCTVFILFWVHAKKSGC